MNGLTKPRDFGDGCPLTNERYVWSCAIGGLKPVPVPSGGDAPMRRAVERAFLELTGHEAQACFSGWGEEFAEPARAVIENRIPVEMAGAGKGADLMTHDPTAIVRAALEAAADSLIETSVWCDSQERADASWHNGVVDARKHHMRRILAIDPSTVLSKLEEPWQDIATAPPERIWVDIDENPRGERGGRTQEDGVMWQPIETAPKDGTPFLAVCEADCGTRLALPSCNHQP